MPPYCHLITSECFKVFVVVVVVVVFETYGIIKYSSGWRNCVVHKCL